MCVYVCVCVCDMNITLSTICLVSYNFIIKGFNFPLIVGHTKGDVNLNCVENISGE